MGCIRIYGYTPIFYQFVKIVAGNICGVSDFCNFAVSLLNNYLIILINDAYEEITTPVFGSFV